jgi:hypothetical protein
MEYKVGDIVVGWHNNIVEGFRYKPWKITHITSDKQHAQPNNKEEYNTFISGLRLATIEELEEYVKENNTSIEEILEICKNLYPIGSKVIPVAISGSPYSECTLEGRIEIYDDDWIGSGPTPGFLYVQGKNKFARLVEKSNPEELPFKVGDKFSINGLQNKGYIIADINFTQRKIKLKCHASFLYTIEEVTRYFEKGTWKLELSTLKKEDFYNTKIDVSESEELSRLVQEKLIELGFNWRVLSGVNYLYIDNEKAVQYGIEVSTFKGAHNKQIYPQDLGININNKQTINNGKQEIKNNSSISKVQGLDKQISNSSRTGGIGLERTRSQISLGTINSPNKVGLSKC